MGTTSGKKTKISYEGKYQTVERVLYHLLVEPLKSTETLRRSSAKTVPFDVNPFYLHTSVGVAYPFKPSDFHNLETDEISQIPPTISGLTADLLPPEELDDIVEVLNAEWIIKPFHIWDDYIQRVAPLLDDVHPLNQIRALHASGLIQRIENIPDDLLKVA
jgi:hypothetical protein